MFFKYLSGFPSNGAIYEDGDYDWSFSLSHQPVHFLAHNRI